MWDWDLSHKGHAWTDRTIFAPQVYLRKDVWLTTLFCAAHQAPAVELSLVRWRRAWLARDESLKLLEAIMSLSPILPSSIPNGESHWPAPAEINFELFGALSINLKGDWLKRMVGWVVRGQVVGRRLWVVRCVCLKIKKKFPFPWKRSNPCIFVLERSRQIQHLQTKQQKHEQKQNKNKQTKILWILSFFTMKLPEEAKKIKLFPKFQRWMKKTNRRVLLSWRSWRSGNFDVETETGITESLVARTSAHIYRALVAQLIEHRSVTREVVSSTPVGPTLRVLK